MNVAILFMLSNYYLIFRLLFFKHTSIINDVYFQLYNFLEEDKDKIANQELNEIEDNNYILNFFNIKYNK